MAETGVSKRAERLAAIVVRAGDAACAERLRAKSAAVKAKAKREWLDETASAVTARLAAENKRRASAGSEGATRMMESSSKTKECLLE